MFQLRSILRPHLLTLTPYSSARDEYSGHRLFKKPSACANTAAAPWATR